MKIWMNSMLLTGSALTAFAVSPCPTVGPSSFQGSNAAYITAGGGCNSVVTIAANGTASIAVANPNGYDGVEDTLVGVVNNSASPISILTLSGAGISGFEGDGICTYAAGGAAGSSWTAGPSSAYCTSSALAGTDPQDYYGPNMTFTNFATGSAVTINFTTPIPPGGTSFFSLEAAPSNSLTITPGGPPPATPAPSSILLIAIGACALGTYGYFLRARKNATL